MRCGPASTGSSATARRGRSGDGVYYVDAGDLPLAQAVAALVRDLVADAERMGIEMRRPALFVPEDAEESEYPMPPGCRRILADAASQLGWEWDRLVSSGASDA